nr:YibE/F family protein [Desulfosporosinus sp. SRJS8]
MTPFILLSACVIITVFTLFLIGGWNKKTFSAIIGTLCGLSIAAYLSVLIGDLSHLTGVVDEEFYLLGFLPQDLDFSYQGLLFAGIIIGSLGAVMDVSMSIASAVNELEESSSRIGPFQLIKAGMSVGKDTIGTMANTLILAYAEGSLYLLFLLAAENISLYQLINSESIASEILRSMAGSIGLVIAVPVTAIVAGMLSFDGFK